MGLILGWEYALEEGMATHSSILVWRIPWIEEPGRLQSTGVSKSRTRLKRHSMHTHACACNMRVCICIQQPRDRS